MPKDINNIPIIIMMLAAIINYFSPSFALPNKKRAVKNVQIKAKRTNIIAKSSRYIAS